MKKNQISTIYLINAIKYLLLLFTAVSSIILTSCNGNGAQDSSLNQTSFPDIPHLSN